LPYSFHLVPRKSEAARVQINTSILTDALTPPKVSSSTTPAFSPEDVFELVCEPQAVFRVRSVGRCSATLSGRSAGLVCSLELMVRSCVTHSMLCSFPYWTIRRYRVWRCYLPYMGHGDRDSKGEHSQIWVSLTISGL